MSKVTFAGSVTAQIASGETIKVTQPDSSIDTITTTTKADLTFTMTKDYIVAGSYSAVASVAADAGNSAATSPSVPFTITLATRTISLNITVT